MLTVRWSVAIVIAALGAGAALYLQGDLGRPTAHAETPLELLGTLDAPGLDPTRCRVRCTPVRLETELHEHWADIEPDGRFRIPDLADTDYRLEIVARHDPSLVLGLAEFVRPGGEPLIVTTDPAALWGEAVPSAGNSNTD
ncbi:MAG: hypothetical protein ABL998_02785 [Planctomycetota bacterium]